MTTSVLDGAVLDNLHQLIGSDEFNLLSEIHQAGGSKQIYVVGGFVRDLLLKKLSLEHKPGVDYSVGSEHQSDIDIVVIGKSSDVADQLSTSKTLKVTRIKEHPEFGTGTYQLDIINREPVFSIKLDMATARKEIYKEPAKLPEVTPIDDIRIDLKRRDFTINAVAMEISPCLGKIHDVFNGFADMENRIVRTLHEKSFVDDPTRIYRAFRFANRLDFTICILCFILKCYMPLITQYFKGNRDLAAMRFREVVNACKILSGSRRLAEVKLALSEAKFEGFYPENIIDNLFPGISNLTNHYHALETFWDTLATSRRFMVFFEKDSSEYEWKVLLSGWGIIMGGNSLEKEIPTCFSLPSGTIKELIKMKEYYEKFCTLRGNPEPFEVYRLLKGAPKGTSFLLAVREMETRPDCIYGSESIERFVKQDRDFILLLNGKDDVMKGLAGKQIQIVKDAVLRACINSNDPNRITAEFQKAKAKVEADIVRNS